MPVTAEFAQILIIGIEAAVWLGLLVGAIFGTGGWQADLVRNWESIALLAGTALALALGVVVDRLADSGYTLFRNVPIVSAVMARTRMRTRDFLPRSLVGNMRDLVTAGDNQVVRLLEYQRNRQRVARATVFNLVLLMPAGGWFLAVRTDARSLELLAFEILVGAGVVASIAATEIVGGAWVSQLVKAYRDQAEKSFHDALTETPSGESFDERERAAAVCWRRGPKMSIEFLIIRTKKPDLSWRSFMPSKKRFWTFPKGGKEQQDRTLADTAKREADEEAGVKLPRNGTFLTTYAYPAPGFARERGYLIDAFLAEYPYENSRETERKPLPEQRKQKWLKLERAIAKLCGGRREFYAAEHWRVLQLADQLIHTSGVAER